MRKEKNKSERTGIGEKIRKSLDLSPDILPHGSRVEIRGGKAVNIYGCGRILGYTPQNIRVELVDKVLSVCGEGIVCVSYSAGEIGLEGDIYTVSFEEEK